MLIYDPICTKRTRIYLIYHKTAKHDNMKKHITIILISFHSYCNCSKSSRHGRRLSLFYEFPRSKGSQQYKGIESVDTVLSLIQWLFLKKKTYSVSTTCIFCCSQDTRKSQRILLDIETLLNKNSVTTYNIDINMVRTLLLLTFT